ncbi:MAG: STAS domain-containing protein [Acidobacteria bacterium]|nr:STAS domain-containing protein [Acidobacteriota bacterium]
MLSHRSAGPVEVVSFSGALDAAATPSARRDLKAILEGGRNRILVDLSQVTFMDSSGLSILVTALKAARAQGGDVLLLSPAPIVRTLVRLTRLDRVLQCVEDESAALAKLGGAE